MAVYGRLEIRHIYREDATVPKDLSNIVIVRKKWQLHCGSRHRENNFSQ